MPESASQKLVQISARQPQLEGSEVLTVLYGRNQLLRERKGHRQLSSFGTPWWQRLTGVYVVEEAHGGVKGGEGRVARQGRGCGEHSPVHRMTLISFG